ncbi:hypothetical protein HA402_011138 [Bradysia odoriphaga]|nr:hypothetical protein HA402_011138 [Bradysia odoriphaga]
MTANIDSACVQRTMDIALASVKEGGRPFATVIADEKGNIIAEATNQVAQTHDPTAHAEIEAIRIACRKLETEHLTNCTFYVLAHPCPMCLAAMYYCSPNKVVFLTTREDYGKYYKDSRRWFTFETFYNEFGKDYTERNMPTIYHPQEETLKIYQLWEKLNRK